MIHNYIVYARVSSERQRNNTSIESQIEKCITYVSTIPATKGDTHRIFPDPIGDGVSPYVFADVESASDPDNDVYKHIVAGTIEAFFRNNRPNLWKAIEACVKYKCNLIVAYVDRLSRQTVIENIINQIFADNGLQVLCADATTALERSIKSLLAQEENRQRRYKIIEGVNRAKKTVAETGKYPNGREVTFFDKDGNPRYGGPAPKDNRAALASVKVRKEKMWASAKYKAADYLLNLFAEQDFLRLQRRLKNLALCREHHLSLSQLRENGYAHAYDTPMSMPDFVYIANVYAPEWAQLLETGNKRAYSSAEIYQIVRRHTEAGDRFVRVKIWESLYDGKNIAMCLKIQTYGEKRRSGDKTKRVINAFCLRRQDYDAILEMGEDAFGRILASHDKSGMHNKNSKYYTPKKQKILTAEVVAEAITND